MTIRPRLLTRVALIAAPVVLAMSAAFSASEGLVVGAIVQGVIAAAMAVYGWSLWRSRVHFGLRARRVTGWESREPYFPWQKKLSQLLGDYKTLMKWDAA